MPTGFLLNPVSPTRKPSCRTRWKKTSFALARLRPSSEYADGLLTESRLANPTAIRSNPMGENQLRPRSVETELRLCRRASYRIPSRQPESHRVKPDGENQLRPRSVETELRVCRRASHRIPSRQPEGHRVEPDGRKPIQNSKITDVYILYMIYIFL